ncbi:photosystem Q(B) protein [Tanacetum coccineum]
MLPNYNMERVAEIEETPHEIGLSHIAFMLWRNNENLIFMTSGALGHEIVSWGMVDAKWKITAMYKAHTNSVFTVTLSCLKSLGGKGYAHVGSGVKEVKVFDIKYQEKQVPLSCEKLGHGGKVYQVEWAPTHSDLVSTRVKKITLHQLSEERPRRSCECFEG